MDSSKRAMVHMAATIKVMCSHVKTIESMRIVNFKDEDIKHASTFRRAIDGYVAQLRRDNLSVPAPVPAIKIPVAEDVIKVSTLATSFKLTGDDNPPEHLLRRTSRKRCCFL